MDRDLWGKGVGGASCVALVSTVRTHWLSMSMLAPIIMQ